MLIILLCIVLVNTPRRRWGIFWEGGGAYFQGGGGLEYGMPLLKVKC